MCRPFIYIIFCLIVKIKIMEDDFDYKLMCEHIKKVLDAYKDLIAKEHGSKEAIDYKERFYQLVDYKR